MLNYGKTISLSRIIRNDRRSVVLPLDHGVSLGPIEGIKIL